MDFASVVQNLNAIAGLIMILMGCFIAKRQLMRYILRSSRQSDS